MLPNRYKIRSFLEVFKIENDKYSGADEILIKHNTNRCSGSYRNIYKESRAIILK